MKKIVLALVLLLSASLSAEVLYGTGVSLMTNNNITGLGLVSAAALQGDRQASGGYSSGCGMFSCGCGC